MHAENTGVEISSNIISRIIPGLNQELTLNNGTYKWFVLYNVVLSIRGNCNESKSSKLKSSFELIPFLTPNVRVAVFLYFNIFFYACFIKIIFIFFSFISLSSHSQTALLSAILSILFL